MSKSYRVAVIGAGAMGKKHVEGWQLAGHHVVSVTDLNVEAAREAASRYGVEQVYADYREAVVRDDNDIVSICLPLKFHAEAAVFAAEQGKHVFCEKPLASTSEQARAIEVAVQRAGVQFGIGFQRSYGKDAALYQQYVRAGKLGRPLFFQSENLMEVRPKIAMHDDDGNQGPVMDMCCHSFNLWQSVFQSRAKSVFASGRILAKDRPELASLNRLAIDTASIVVEYESGDVGAMTVSWGLPAATKLRSRTPDRIIGPLGAIEAAGGGQWNVFIGRETETVQLDHGHLHALQFAQFARSLDEGTPYPIGLRIGQDILALTEAVFRSIHSGRVEQVVYAAALDQLGGDE